jgi:hypothetical protein
MKEWVYTYADRYEVWNVYEELASGELDVK